MDSNQIAMGYLKYYRQQSDSNGINQIVMKQCVSMYIDCIVNQLDSNGIS